MLTDSIKQKIQELFESTPENVGVAYGIKMTNGEFTEDVGITFLVENKLPLDQIPADQVLPSSVNIDGVDYVTDVVQVGKVKTLVCDSVTENNCYGWQTSAPGNRGTVRPLKGGVSLGSYNNQGHVGTLGFIAVETTTQALVGVTNSHVVVLDAFYTSDRNLNGIVENELSDNVYQNGENYTPDPTLKIGEVLRYVPTYLSSDNKVDGALISLSSANISNTESIRQYGLSYTAAMPFASTAEINNIVATNPLLYSSGRTSGAKGEGVCGLRILAIGTSSPVSGYNLQGTDQSIPFTNSIVFTRSSSQCPYPIAAGDSGSVLIANFGGTWKIIGLCFAGSETIGWACRIDDVASELGIEAWDGTTKNYVNLATKTYKTSPTGSSAKTLTCSGSVYWQVGLANTSSPC